MAVIQKIRNKYGKVAAGVIVVALVGFILMDAASGKFGDYFGRNTSVVKVNGDKIDVKEYSQNMKDFETLYTLYSKNHTLDEATRAQMNEEALKLEIYEKLSGVECEKLGVTTTKEEERELIYSPNADPMVQQFALQGTTIFSNPETGRFDPARVQAFEKQADQYDPSGNARKAWETVKAYVIHNHIVTKFNFLFINGVYTPKFILERQADDANQAGNITYVKVPFTTVADKDVPVTDDDLKAYVKKYSSRFKVDEPSRSIEYVSFDIKPSHEDTARALDALNQIKNDFAAATDNESFVNRNSENKYAPVWVNKKAVTKPFEDSIVSLPVGGVYGPYYSNSMYKITKVMERKELPDTVKCRHILVRTKAQGREMMTDSAAKLRLDSAVAAIKAGGDFKALALKYSDDEGSSKNGGEYIFSVSQKTGISKEFGDFVFEGHTGENKIVKVENDNYSGYHYIEILEQKNIQPAVKIATIEKSLYAGDNTVNGIYAKATEFAGNNTSATAFDDAVKAKGLDKKVGENIKVHDFQIQGIGPAREMVRWIYDAKVGDVSNVFTLDGHNVVAKLVSIQDKGTMNITASIKPMLEGMVRNEKKADMLLAKYKGVTSLQAAAQTSGQQVQHADSVTLGASYVANLGYVPAVLGYSFYPGFQVNTVSPAIKGEDAIYLISVSQRWKKPANPAAAQMLMQQKQQMEMQTRNSVSQQLQDLLINKATIKYTPSNM